MTNLPLRRITPGLNVPADSQVPLCGETMGVSDARCQAPNGTEFICAHSAGATSKHEATSNELKEISRRIVPVVRSLTTTSLASQRTGKATQYPDESSECGISRWVRADCRRANRNPSSRLESSAHLESL